MSSKFEQNSHQRQAYTFFLAYSSADAERARELKRLLEPEVSAFVATDLPVGVRWNRELPRYQRESLATVALIGSAATIAYFLDEEIHAAINYWRSRPDRHQLIVVFLEGIQAVPVVDQYGFLTRQALDATKLGLEGVAAELKQRATTLQAAATQAAPVDELAEGGPAAAAMAAFSKAYRACFAAMIEHSGLGVSGSHVAPKRHLPELNDSLGARSRSVDTVYVPLRFQRTFHAGSAELAGGGGERTPQLIQPDDLVERSASIVIHGGSGTGKTVWLSWTFKRLLEGADVFPVLVDLQRVVKAWSSGSGGEDSQLQYLLRDLIGEHLPGYDELILYQLSEPRAPRPILLIDDFGELGAVADSFRRALVTYLRINPWILAVVAVRTTEDAAEFTRDGFEPFSPESPNETETVSVATRLFALEHAPAIAQELAEEFHGELRRNPAAVAFASTPFLVTLLVGVANADRSLPARRHALYARIASVAFQVRADPQVGRPDVRPWCPTPPHEVWVGTGILAFTIQDSTYRSGKRVLGELSREELERALGSHWSAEQRRGFLLWLTDVARLLECRAPDRFSFVHLSLQEYFSAWYLVARETRLVRQAFWFEKYSFWDNWWQTVVLWAAVLEERRPQDLPFALEHLTRNKEGGYWLAGAILAEGVGDEEAFSRWKAQLRSRFARANACAWRTAEAFQLSSDARRRQAIERELSSAALGAVWPVAGRIANWLAEARLAAPALPDSTTMAGLCLELRPSPAPTQRDLAVGRIAVGIIPLWPLRPVEALLLRAWPSPRVSAGIRMQTLASLGRTKEELTSGNVSTLWNTNRVDEAVVYEMEKAFAQQFAEFGRDMAGVLGAMQGQDLVLLDRSFDRRFAADFGSNFAHEFAKNAVAQFGQFMMLYIVQYLGEQNGLRDWGLKLVRHVWQNRGVNKEALQQAFVLDAVRKFGSDFVRKFLRRSFVEFGTWFDAKTVEALPEYVVTDYEQTFAKQIGAAFGKYKLENPLNDLIMGHTASVWESSLGIGMRTSLRDMEEWMGDLFGLELMPWRFGIHAQLSRLDDPRVPWPHARLIAAACGATLGDGAARTRASEQLRSFDGDPLWPALARHLMGESSASDHALLESLARNPEQRPAPLEWALRYYVRGDVVFSDFSEATLDELCARAKLPMLPYL